jgi:restriction endonuclease Mrr
LKFFLSYCWCAAITASFGDSTYKPKNTQIHLNIDRLKDYIEKDKGGDFNLTEKDLKRLATATPVKQPVQEKPVLPTVNVNGVQWVIDSATEKAYKKNNPSVVMDLMSFMDTVDPQTQEKIMSLI